MIAVNVNTLKTTFVNVKDPIKSASRPYSIASTRAFPAVDIPASRIAMLNAIPDILNIESSPNIITGAITSLMTDTAIEGER